MSSNVHAKWMKPHRAHQRRIVADPLAQPVLDRLDVVIRLALDRLDALPWRSANLGDARASPTAGAGTARPPQWRLGSERDQPLDLDPNAMDESSELAEPAAERSRLQRVPSVERRDRGERRERHASMRGRAQSLSCALASAALRRASRRAPAMTTSWNITAPEQPMLYSAATPGIAVRHGRRKAEAHRYVYQPLHAQSTRRRGREAHRVHLGEREPVAGRHRGARLVLLGKVPARWCSTTAPRSTIPG